MEGTPGVTEDSDLATRAESAMYFTRNVTGLLGHTDSVLIMVLKDEANKGRRRLQ